MNFKRLLNTPIGVFFVSLLLGLGLACLFRKVCKDKDCIHFNGPVISEIDGKTYKYGEYCYKYNLQAAPCEETKQTVELSPPEKVMNGSGVIPGTK